MSPSPLSIDVYVSPMRPSNSPDPLGDGEEATWAPSNSTLISGPTEGILIDPADVQQRRRDRGLGEEFRQADHRCVHHPRTLRPLARSRAAPRTLPRSTRLRGAGSRRSRGVGSRIQTRPPGTGRRVSRVNSPSRRCYLRCWTATRSWSTGQREGCQLTVPGSRFLFPKGVEVP